MKECILIVFLVVNLRIIGINSNVTFSSEPEEYVLPQDGYFLDELNEIGLANLE